MLSFDTLITVNIEAHFSQSLYKAKHLLLNTLREKFPNTELFLVRISGYLVFGMNTEIYWVNSSLFGLLIHAVIDTDANSGPC